MISSTIYEREREKGSIENLVSYDREELILLYHALGFPVQKVVLQEEFPKSGGKKISVSFLEADCVKINQKLLSGEDIQITYHNNLVARNWWRDILVLSKGKVSVQ